MSSSSVNNTAYSISDEDDESYMFYSWQGSLKESFSKRIGLPGSMPPLPIVSSMRLRYTGYSGADAVHASQVAVSFTDRTYIDGVSPEVLDKVKVAVALHDGELILLLAKTLKEGNDMLASLNESIEGAASSAAWGGDTPRSLANYKPAPAVSAPAASYAAYAGAPTAFATAAAAVAAAAYESDKLVCQGDQIRQAGQAGQNRQGGQGGQAGQAGQIRQSGRAGQGKHAGRAGGQAGQVAVLPRSSSSAALDAPVELFQQMKSPSHECFQHLKESIAKAAVARAQMEGDEASDVAARDGLARAQGVAKRAQDVVLQAQAEFKDVQAALSYAQAAVTGAGTAVTGAQAHAAHQAALLARSTSAHVSARNAVTAALNVVQNAANKC
ncbi:hypothetical protein FOA52_005426 [Chlamydomonas sp. UWO 241]|nr:hypothetical protein FOA52_005426 [Chlamydomonas sp. UWO 241]